MSRPEGNSYGRPSIVFVLMLIAFVSESQLTQYVETSLNYRKPYMLFYIAHTSMSIIFPLHLLYLHLTSPFPIKAYLRGLATAAKDHLVKQSLTSSSETGRNTVFPFSRYLTVLSWCTFGVTIPALLWFAALPLASVSDITALWNTNAFWAYVISVKLKHQNWESRRLVAVVVASVGVLAVVYGSNGSESPSKDHPKAPLIGCLLSLIASVGYGLYQVLYNMYAVPPSEREHDTGDWQRLSISSDGISIDEELQGINSIEDTVYPPPFGLYANALTSGMGIITFMFLWIPLPLLHMSSIEPFEWPSDMKTLLAIGGIALSALTFLTTFMILLAVWGPIITSVGNLLTIVLVIISDIIFGNAANTITRWSILGSTMIVCAFAVLAYESFRR
ncbi:hypothetical protein PNOK_0192000 [Pyrrhoderma noxium]|uniref:EamA domain-containing protein n=1 Tax=Pyrrhoderma noxium TaxID=2282107 RepID=A0A286UQU2_9AGAM|nr:hypothetical protein PNOK_0192000 [Pyrrhoderma noxium]